MYHSQDQEIYLWYSIPKLKVFGCRLCRMRFSFLIGGICFIACSLLEEHSHAMCDHIILLLGHGHHGRRILVVPHESLSAHACWHIEYWRD